MWEALFLILAIAAALGVLRLWCNLALFGLVLVVLRLAKKAGLDIMPCG